MRETAMNWKHTLARAAAVGIVTGIVALPVDTAVAATTVTAPATIYYGTFGPDTPVTVNFATEQASSIARIEIADTIIDGSCTAGSTSLAVTPIAGDAVVEGDLAAGTGVTCQLTLALALPATPPATGLVEVIELDVFGVEIARGWSAVTFKAVDVTFTAGDTELVDGVYEPSAPRSIGDTLSYSLGVDADVAAPLSVQPASGTNASGCPPATTTALACTITRVLSAADLIDLTAPMSATVLADGFPVAVYDRTVTVFAERRVGLEIVVTPTQPRVGNLLTVDLTIENQGTVALDDFVLTGGDLGVLDCEGSPIADVSLTPGQSVACSSSRRLTVDDVHPNTPITVRAVSAVPGDSDNIDHDPTAADDVDAALPVPFTVGNADVAVRVAVADPVVVLPVPALATDQVVVRTAATVTLTTGTDLEHARVELPLSPAPGVSLVDCDDVVGDKCRMEFPAIELSAGATLTRTFAVEIDTATLDAGGAVDVFIAGRLIASSGIVQDIEAAVVSVGGITAVLLTPVVDLSAATTTAVIAITARPGLPVAVVLEPAFGVTVGPCTGPDGDVPVSAGAGEFSLGVLVPTTSYLCDVVSPVTAENRQASTFGMLFDVTTSAGPATQVSVWSASPASRALVVTPLASPTAPVDGYHPDGDDARPDTVVQSFDVRILGDTGTSVSDAPVTSSASSAGCLAVDAASWTCSVAHAVSADDLVRGFVDFDLGVGVTVDDMVLTDSATAQVEVLHKSAALSVTELSSPTTPDGYRPGQPINVLVQVRNEGTMAFSFAGVVLDGAVMADGAVPPATQVTLEPGQTFDVAFAVTVSANSITAPTTMLSFTVGAGAGSETVELRVPVTRESLAPAPAPAPAPSDDPLVVPTAPGPPWPELPVTGSSPAAVVLLGFVLLVVGIALRLWSRPGRRRSTTPTR